MDILFSVLLLISSVAFLGVTIVESRKTKKIKKQLEQCKVELISNSDQLFDFEIIQERKELLKRNSGPNLCEEQKKIKYVEYCETVKY